MLVKFDVLVLKVKFAEDSQEGGLAPALSNSFLTMKCTELLRLGTGGEYFCFRKGTV
jgi:hypothetical protein